jgi:hypothetical protein
MNTGLWSSRLQQVVWWGTLVIIVGLPFHVLGYSLLHEHLISLSGPFRNWKEVLTLLLDLVAAGIILLRREPVWRRTDLILIGLFAVLHLVFMAFTPETAAAILATKVNLVFLLLYAAATFGPQLTSRRQTILTWAILIPAALAGLFGLLQLWVLPHDYLIHWGFGYGADQIRPFELIQNSNILRIQSFMFGPNQYGSYLTLPLILAMWLAVTKQALWTRLAAGALVLLLLVNLYGSQSRGSWIGAAVGLIALFWFLLGKWGHVGLAAFAGIVAAVVLISLPQLSQNHWAYILRHNTPGASVSASDSTDSLHYQRLKTGITKVQEHPLGEGLTASGRASDLTGQSFYTENFYLQIADQIGIEGLLLLLAIIVVVAWRLTSLGGTGLAYPLLASLIGLSVMNLFSHTWSDGATALLWWGSAGLTLAGYRRG